MPCNVRLYDTGYTALTASMQVIPIDVSTAGRPNLCAVVHSSSAGLAYLNFNLAQCVYQVSISDPQRSYGHVLIPALNGNVAGQLEIVLNRLPPPSTGGRGAAVTSASQLSSFMVSRSWSNEQQAAVLGVVNALVLVRGAAGQTSQYLEGLYSYTLEERSISPSAF
jgi:hypothetical protein